MGADKALIPIDGVPLAERVARTLEAAGCDPVVLVGGNERELASTGRRVVADLWPGDGPVGGVVTALTALADAPAVLVAACDLPALSAEAVSAVIAAHRGAVRREASVAVTMADSGRPEPALACWSTSAVDAVAEQFSVERALLAVARAVGAATVTVDARALRNANRPGDLPEADRRGGAGTGTAG